MNWNEYDGQQGMRQWNGFEDAKEERREAFVPIRVLSYLIELTEEQEDEKRLSIVCSSAEQQLNVERGHYFPRIFRRQSPTPLVRLPAII